MQECGIQMTSDLHHTDYIRIGLYTLVPEHGQRAQHLRIVFRNLFSISNVAFCSNIQ